MADLYGTSTPSPPGNAPTHESEDISTFLNHLLNSSSSSSTPFKPKPMHAFSSVPPLMPPAPGNTSSAGAMVPSGDFHRFGGSELGCRIRVGNRVDSSSGVNFSDPGVYFPADVKESTENDLGDFSCDSEGTGGASEVQLNPAPSSRTSSKRTRAAEVHNLSEKRRRSRINEKMKALQNLIPNSNKTDKASMLDEAIEYLKQLQLQVQMLSMRNGMSLHPMCLGELPQHVQLSQMRMGFDEEGNGLPSSTIEARQLSENSKRTAFNLSNQNTMNLQNATPSTTNITDSEAPFSFEQAEYEPFTLSTSSKEICKEVTLSELQGDMSGSGKNSSSSVS